MGKNKKATLEIGFVVGNIARLLSRKGFTPDGRYSDYTHYWKVYLKGLNDENISSIVKSVTFGLHRTCVPSIITLTSPPYEVSQKGKLKSTRFAFANPYRLTGWGEFVIYVTIDFVDDMEDSVTLEHLLRLYPDGIETSLTPKVEIQSESVHYVVFENPSPVLYDKLAGIRSRQTSQRKGDSYASEVVKLKNARNIIKSEKSKVMDRIKEIQESNAQTREDIDNLFRLIPIVADETKFKR